jgi:hypothetical protein
MIGIIISALVSVLVIYALYNSLGYYEEFKKNSNLKDIENLLSDAQKILGKNEEQKEEFLVKKNEEETTLIRALDQKSQENLSLINGNEKNLSLVDFKNFCNQNYTNFLKFLHERKIEEIQNFANEPTIEKLKKISDEKLKDLNLIKILDIKILQIEIQDNFLIIKVEFFSEEMISDGENHFSNKNFSRIIEYGHSLEKFNEGERWIILNVEAIDF